MATIAVKGTEPLVWRDLCGGVLITPDRIATASHCLDHTDPSAIEVHLGASVLTTTPGQIVPIKGFATDPGYRIIPSPTDPDNFDASAAADDIAVIELARPVRGVPTIPVAHRPPAVGTPVQLYGHGLTESILSGSGHDIDTIIGNVLQRGDLKTISHRSCNAQLGGLVDPASVLCAEATAAVCSGDSGGPLLHRTPRGPELVGIVSFADEVVGKDCGEGTYPGGFANAAVFRSWLLRPHPVLAPMPLGAPTITGTLTAATTLTCRPPAWSARARPSVSYQWEGDKVYSDGSTSLEPISGATKATLDLTPKLAEHHVDCIVIASTAGGTVQLHSESL
jgi:secreted trypsin-like serine protease